MVHEETVRLVPGADTAVLFIHGIVGTPNHFRERIPLEQTVPENWSVYNLLLPGHGGSVEDFADGSMKQWREYAFAVFEKLTQQHRHMIVVGHSMGTLFAIQLGLHAPEKIPFLFLLAVPLRPWIRPSCAVNCLRLAFGRIREERPMEVALRNACGVAPTPLVWRYLKWIPRFLELFREIGVTEKQLSKLRIPCVAWQSRIDELVMNLSYGVLKRSGVMEVYELKESSHFYYAPEDMRKVLDDFCSRCEQWKKQD